MKSLLFALLLFSQGYVTHAQEIDDPNAEIRKVDNFHGINISNSFEIYISQGQIDAVAVSAADKADNAKISVKVINGILYIGLDKNGWRWTRASGKFKAYISVKDLDQIVVSGASNLRIKGAVSCDELSIKLSGASNFKADSMVVKKMAVDLSGASDLKISGSSQLVYISASGASTFKGFDFSVDVCDIRASGASDVKVMANQTIKADASGASDIRYKGEAVMKDIHTSGASSVKKG